MIKQGDIAAELRGTQLQDLVRRAVKIHIQPVDLVDGRKQRCLALPDQSAFGDMLLAGATRDRRGHRGIAQIDTGGLDIGLDLLDQCLRGTLRGVIVVHVRAGDQATGQQVASAFAFTAALVAVASA